MNNHSETDQDQIEKRLAAEKPDCEEQITVPGGLRLHYSEWQPATMPGTNTERATILLVHGYGEHLGRYGRLARRLTTHGFRVGGCDHRGMGRSGGTPMYVQDYADYVQDLMVAQARLQQGHEQRQSENATVKHLPVFVFGHSMGGLVALRHAQRYADKPFAGTVLSGPLLGVSFPVPAWQVMVGKMLARIMPRFHFPLHIRPELLTHDPEEQLAAATDPLLPKFTTPGWFMATNWAMEAAKQEIDKVCWPTLWQIGGADQVCSPQASRDVFTRLKASPELSDESSSAEHYTDSLAFHEWCEYPGLLHEVHNERSADRDRAFADLLAWLNAHLDKEC